MVRLEINGLNYLPQWEEDLILHALKSFEDMVPKYINDVLDRGYDVLRNNPITLADNIRPTKQLIKEAVKEFQDIAAQKGLTLNDELARDMVDEVWKGARLTKRIYSWSKNSSWSSKI